MEEIKELKKRLNALEKKISEEEKKKKEPLKKVEFPVLGDSTAWNLILNDLNAILGKYEFSDSDFKEILKLEIAIMDMFRYACR